VSKPSPEAMDNKTFKQWFYIQVIGLQLLT